MRGGRASVPCAIPREEATRKNMEALGFPMGGNVDTFLMRDEQEDWTSDALPAWSGPPQ